MPEISQGAATRRPGPGRLHRVPKITSYAALTAAAAADVLPIVDVDDTTLATTGTTKTISLQQLQPVFNVMDYGAAGNGTAGFLWRAARRPAKSSKAWSISPSLRGSSSTIRVKS